MKLADSVLARIVQIVQEAMLSGVDAADIMRALEVEVSANDSNVLVLTEQYKKIVEAQHAKMLEFAAENAPVLQKKFSTNIGDIDTVKIIYANSGGPLGR